MFFSLLTQIHTLWKELGRSVQESFSFTSFFLSLCICFQASIPQHTCAKFMDEMMGGWEGLALVHCRKN